MGRAPSRFVATLLQGLGLSRCSHRSQAVTSPNHLIIRFQINKFLFILAILYFFSALVDRLCIQLSFSTSSNQGSSFLLPPCHFLPLYTNPSFFKTFSEASLLGSIKATIFSDFKFSFA
jgi:hypothetical protein